MTDSTKCHSTRSNGSVPLSRRRATLAIAMLLVAGACGSPGERSAQSPARLSDEAGTDSGTDVAIGSVNVPSAGNLSVGIYDGSGQLVRTLFSGSSVAAGAVPLTWDGRDDYNNTLPGGTYAWRAILSTASMVDDGSVGDNSPTPWDVGTYGTNVQSVAVDPSGNVYESSTWEEFHEELRSWAPDGTRRWGGSFQGLGAALAADSDFVYAAHAAGQENHIVRFPTTNESTASALGPTPWPAQAATGYILANSSGGHGVFGLAVDGTTLWVSNHAQNLVQLYDKASGAAKGQFSVSDPHGIAADGAGHVWVTSGKDQVTLYDPSGSVLKEIPGLSQPFAVAAGGPSGHLYVGEAATGLVKEYDSSLALIRTHFGAATPGPVHDNLLRWPDTVDPECANGDCSAGPGGALAVDANGHLVVADFGNHRVQVFASDDTLILSRLNGEPTTAQVDPGVDPNIVHSGGLEYHVDYTPGSTYGSWYLLNNWAPRRGQPFGPLTLHRKLDGRDYIYFFDQVNGAINLYVYQIGPDGSERESAVVGSNGSGKCAGLYVGVDGDSSGTIDPAEITCEAGSPSHGTAPGWWVDESGNVFIASGPAVELIKLPLIRFDDAGNPVYDWGAAVKVASTDNTFWNFQASNVRVDPLNGDVYRIGATTQAPIPSSDPYYMGGTTVERVTANGGGRSLYLISPTTNDPRFGSIGGGAVAVDTAGAPGAAVDGPDGNFFYTGQFGVDLGGIGMVDVKMLTRDGLLVTQSTVGATDGSNSGAIDTGFGLTAFTLGSVHYVYSEDSYHPRAIRFRVDHVDTLQRLNDPGGTAFSWTPSQPPQMVSLTAAAADAIDGASAPVDITLSRTDSRGALAVTLSVTGRSNPVVVEIPNGSFTTTFDLRQYANPAMGTTAVAVAVVAESGYALGSQSSASVTFHPLPTVSVSASPPTIQVEGPSATFTITRDNADESLPIGYIVGPPYVNPSSVAVSSWYRDDGASHLNDGDPSTYWLSGGYASQDGADDPNAPSLTYTFDRVYPLGLLRVSNYNGDDPGRVARDVQITISDGSHETVLARSLEPSPTPAWQEVDLGGVGGSTVTITIETNGYGARFPLQQSQQELFPSRTMASLSEVEFYSIGAGPNDYQPIPNTSVTGHFSSGTIDLATDQTSGSITVTPTDLGLVNQPTKQLELRVLPNKNFALPQPTSAASVDIVDDHVGPVVTVSAVASYAAPGGAPGVVRFSRDGAGSRDLTVAYATATVPVPIVSATASSTMGADVASQSYDGRLDTAWSTTGNSDHEGQDDSPSITYRFDQVHPIGHVRICNWLDDPSDPGRRADHIEILASTDGQNFQSIATEQLQEYPPGTPNVYTQSWQDFDLGAVPALAIRIKVLDNYYGTVFFQGKSYEGPGSFSNRSVTGLAEVLFLTGSTAPPSDFAEALSGSVVIPAGQPYVDLDLGAVASATVGDYISVTATSDDTVYSVGSPASATVTVGQVVSVSAVEPYAMPGGAPAVVRFSRGSSTATDLTVTYATATVPVPIVAATPSSSLATDIASQSYDGRLDTAWSTTGNSDHEGQDDSPSITYRFDQVHPIGHVRICNWLDDVSDPGRRAHHVEILASTDGLNFQSIATEELQEFPPGAPNLYTQSWQDFDLGDVPALAVRINVLDNYWGTVFFQGKSYEGPGSYSNKSVTGLAEVLFLTGSAAPASDFGVPLSGSIVIPAGQSYADLDLSAGVSATIGDYLTFTATTDDSAYLVASPSSATVTVGQVVSVSAAEPYAARGGAPAVVRFSRGSPMPSDLTVTYATATVPVPIVGATPSSSLATDVASQSYDGRLDTAWSTTGNSDHEGQDDSPSITYRFDQVHAIGRVRICNWLDDVSDPGRRADHIEILASTDGQNFRSIATEQLQEYPPGAPNLYTQSWQDFDLGDVPALAIRINVLDNYWGTVFFQGKSYEGPGSYSNKSVTGLAEVLFLTGSTAPPSDFAETLSGSVVIPAGQSYVDLDLSAAVSATVGDYLTVTATTDDTVYSVASPESTTVTVQ